MRAPGAVERTVHLSDGDAASEYALQLTADHLIHAWDMARAVGADPTLDAASVAAVRAWFADREDAYRSGGPSGPRVPLRAVLRCRPKCWPCSGGRRERARCLR